MANRIVVFSETRQDYIAPRNEPIRVLTVKLRRKQGDEALIEVGTGWFKQHKKYKAVFYIPPQRVRVRVERSDNGYWWLVNMEANDERFMD